MRPPGSTTTPLPIRSVPRIGTDLWSRATVAWTLTTHSVRCRTSSTEASTSAPPEIGDQELLDAPMGVTVGRRIEGHGGAGAPRTVLVPHVGQECLGLPFHIEGVVGTGVKHELGRGG